jgi:hypothetical protein
VLHELRKLGLGDDSNTAPVNLAKLLIAHLPDDDVEFHVELLEKRGYRSARSDSSERHADVIEEYCYTAPPDEILLEMSNVRQLLRMAEGLGLVIPAGAGRDLIVDEILKVLGFRSRVKQIEGLQWALARLERQLVELEHAATQDECSSIVRSGLTVLEQVTDVVLRFFGQLVYGSGLAGYLARITGAPRPVRLTLGQKVHALTDLALRPPPFSLEPRAMRVFRWPLLPEELLDSFRRVVDVRNDLAHGRPLGRDFHHAQLEGRTALSTAVEIVRRIAEHPHAPRVVQIVSRQDDEYGRHYFLGRDDRGRVERVFTPLPLQVGALYLLYPLTNPARINPLIFPHSLGAS